VVECYTVARALRPELGEALLLALGVAGRRAEEAALLNRLLLERPGTVFLAFQQGGLLAKQGDVAGAIASYRQALSGP
jgi:hypothetical protein